MSLSYETANELVDRGEFGALRRIAEPYLDNARGLEPRTLLSVAHALVYTGESRRALSLLAPLGVELKVTGLNRSRGHLVLALANRAAGSMTVALGYFQRALHFAQESGNPEDVGWAHVYLFRQMIDSHPVDLAPAMLPSVRASVAKAGSSRIFAFLHQCVAVLEGQNGRFNEALRHCDCSESLLSLSPNLWLHCGNQLNRAAVLLAEYRFNEGLKVLEALRATTQLHGLKHESAKVEANLGHCFSMTGDHDRAIETLLPLAMDPSASRVLTMSAFEGIARAHLWKGDLSRCDEVLAHIERTAAEDEELSRSYILRWVGVTRTKLLLRLGRAEDALAHLDRVENTFHGTSVTPVEVGLAVLKGEALARCGRAEEAARQLNRANLRGVTVSPEVRGRFCDAAALIVRASDAGFASALTARATAIYDAQGTEWMRSASPSPAVAMVSHGSASEIVNRLASAWDLAHSPALAIAEVVSGLQSLGAGVQACRVSPRENYPGGTGDVEVMELATADGQTWRLECQLPADAARTFAVYDAVRIARAVFALERLKIAERNRAALWPADQDVTDDGALFLSQEMRDLAETAKRVASTDVPVLVTGETGTGKEVLARFIHARSLRAKKPFLPFNCTTVPKEMMDSQLFGHRRGAFTGASENFQGVIRSARNGTLLLDEIGDLSLELQPKLLRFLESGEVLPLGESSPVQVDVRVVAATNANLDAAVMSGRFREDLYYRLNIVHLRVPPLRERRVEIPSLSRHYLQRYAIQFKKGELQLAEETMECLLLYAWPGNVRQLANEMRRLAVFAQQGAVLMPEALAPEIGKVCRDLSSSSLSPSLHGIPGPNEILVRLDQPMSNAVEYVERAMLRHAMQRNQGRVEAVAKELGLSRKGLYLKRQRYRVDDIVGSSELA